MNRRLYKSRTDRVIGGVAGGVAQYLDMDPSLVRIVWAILALVTGGLMLLVYLVMWIVVPEAPVGWSPTAAMPTGEPLVDPQTGQPVAPPTDPEWHPAAHHSGNGRLVVGLLLILLGLFFLVREYIPSIRWDLFWPILLVIAGAALLVGALGRRDAG